MEDDNKDCGTCSDPELYPLLGKLYDTFVGDDDERVCKDISEQACRHLPRNFFAYLSANCLTKIADELSSARLVLPWLLGVLGAPAVFAGFLVPVRESGVLLPQLLVAAYTRHVAKKKFVWLCGAVLSCIALVLMAAAAVGTRGVAAGWLILVLVGVFSLARGLCSVSAKDVLGKTISKTRRGALMGYSAGISGIVTLLIGLYIKFYLTDVEGSKLFSLFLLVAAGLWILAVVLFASIAEEPEVSDEQEDTFSAVIQSMALIRTDKAFREYLIARALLLSVALAPPFYVLFAQQNTNTPSGLELLIVASGLAGSFSSPFWGRMSDQSSRTVMVRAATAAGVVGITAWVADIIGVSL